MRNQVDLARLARVCGRYFMASFFVALLPFFIIALTAALTRDPIALAEMAAAR